MSFKQGVGHSITKTIIEMAQGNISLSISPFLVIHANTLKKCKSETKFTHIGFWHIWITFATTWFVFANQFLFPISKSNMLDWAIREIFQE
jgi:hypothetical protein